MKINHSPRGDLPGELRHDIVGLAIEESDTEQLHRIIWEHLPLVLTRFAAKNRQYGENEFDMGAAGQYPEIHRKVKLLRSMIWEAPRGGWEAIDSADEVVDDLIGHLLMLKDCFALDRGKRSTVGSASRGLVDATEELAHVMRELKKGPETWVMQDDQSVEQYPPSFKGRHTYIIGDLDDNVKRVMFAAHGHLIAVAQPGDERCGWRTGDPAVPSGDRRCVGIEGHGRGEPLTLSTGSEIHERWHINMEMEAWPV